MNDDDTLELKVFRSLTQNDQIAALYDMLRFIRSEIAIIKKHQLEQDIEFKNARLYNEERLDTSEKIKAILDKRFNVFEWFRDKVLPYIIVAVLFAVFQLTWGKP